MLVELRPYDYLQEDYDKYVAKKAEIVDEINAERDATIENINKQFDEIIEEKTAVFDKLINACLHEVEVEETEIVAENVAEEIVVE